MEVENEQKIDVEKSSDILNETSTTKSFKVFISYSWSSPSHEAWVVSLAERLMSDGVDVKLDKWDLKEGHDKFHFMESMVNSSEINRVLIILDKKYCDKANERSGGVGTETQIISPEIYSNVSQEKFIPIVRERDGDGNAYTPAYLTSRIYIDFSVDESFEVSYDQLLRGIYQRPSRVKPKLGSAPAYLFEDAPNSFRTSTILKSSETILSKYPERTNSIVRNFVDEFYTCLSEFQIEFKPKMLMIDAGKLICDCIHSATPLRNEFFDFFEILFKNNVTFDVDILIKFFEKLPRLENEPVKSNRVSVDGDQYKFINRELFLYIVALGLKYERYAFLKDILHSKYFFTTYHGYTEKPANFFKLHSHITSIDSYYRQTYSMNFISPMADFIIKRIPKGLSKNDLVIADYLCYFISELYPDLNSHDNWFPITYIYKDDKYFDILQRLISQRHFEKVKGLFNVQAISELKSLVLQYTDKMKKEKYRNHGFSNAFSTLYMVGELIDVDTLGSAI